MDLETMANDRQNLAKNDGKTGSLRAKHFPFHPVGKGAKHSGQRSVRTCPEASPLAAGFGDGKRSPARQNG
jgi:hypothetical protein